MMMFKGTHLGEAKLTGAARRSMVTNHEYISYIEVRKTLKMYGTCRDSYIIEV